MDQKSESNENHTCSYNVEDGRTERGWETFEREEWHKAALSNLYTTSIEFDKTLLILNSAIIGFIINLFADSETTGLSIFNSLYYLPGIIAMIFALVSIYALVHIFKTNPDYLEAVLSDDDIKVETLNQELDTHQKKANCYFVLSAAFAIIFAVFIVMNKLFFEVDGQ